MELRHTTTRAARGKALTAATITMALAASACNSDGPTGNGGSDANITLDPTAQYQTMAGWEVIPQPVREWPANLDSYLPQLLDATVEAGMNRVRLESHQQFHHVEAANDNGDPQVLDWSALDFSVFDNLVQKLVVPLRQRLQARGERLIVSFNTVEVGADADAFHRDPDEFAEFVYAHFQHMSSDFGFVPDIVEVSLEPDVFRTFRDGAELAAALVASGARLESEGFGVVPHAAPSMSTLPRTIDWFDDMVAANPPNLFRYLREVPYHRYGVGSEQQNLETLGQRTGQRGVSPSMLEWWDEDNGYQTLHRDLTLAMVSAWQQGEPGGPPTTFERWLSTRLFGVDDSASPPVLIVNPRTMFLRQYYRHVREGAVRIAATSTNAALDPVAFVNPSGRYTVVVKASAGAEVSVALPGGAYGIFYTTHSVCSDELSVGSYDVHLPDAAVSSGGGTLAATMPGCGVMTIYRKG